MKQLYIKNNYIIRRAYKSVNAYDGVDSIYFILADGTVIFVDGTEMKENPAYKIVPNLKNKVYRYGGICKKCNSFMIGEQYNNKLDWRFYCVECNLELIYSDNKVDEIVYNALCILDDEIFND